MGGKWIITASLTLEEAAEPPDAAELPPLAAGDGLFCEDVSIEVSEADLNYECMLIDWPMAIVS